MNDSGKGILFASITALLWGFLAIFLKVTLKYVDPVTVAWFRFAIAFVLLFLFLYIKDRKSVKILIKPPLLAVVASIGLGFNYVGYIKGVELTTPSNAQILIQIAPVILAVVGLVFFKERLTRLQTMGFALAITGFTLFYRDQLSNLITSSEVYNTGIILVLAAGISWVVYAALQKLLVRTYPTQSLNLIIYVVPALLLIPLVDFANLTQIPGWVWLILLFLGVNTLLAYGFLAEAFKYLEANKVGIIITLNPMITIVAMLTLTYLEVSWIEPERISAWGILGALLVVSGAILAVRSAKPKEKIKPDLELKEENVESLTADV